MSYTPAEFETMTGKELDQVKAEFEKADIAPAGWRKMRVSDKRSWLKRNLEEFRKALRPAELPAHVREKKAWNARKKAYYALKDQYRRSSTIDPQTGAILDKGTSGAFVNKRQAVQFLAGQKSAADPVPMTRQVLRQHRRRTEKSALHEAKMQAAKDKRKGGASSVLSAELV